MTESPHQTQRNPGGRRRRIAKRHRRGAALLMTVLATCLVVSMLAFAGVSLVRVERQRVAEINDRLTARSHARSAVELGLQAIEADCDWRQSMVHGAESPRLTLSPGPRPGYGSWMLTDSDGSLADGDTDLRLLGIGRVGQAVQVSAVTLESSGQSVETELRSMTSDRKTKQGDVTSKQSWAQYLRPALPPEATYWWITGLELYVQRRNGRGTFEVALEEPQGNHWPSGVTLASLSVEGTTLDTGWHWRRFDLATPLLRAGDGVCIAVTSQEKNAPLRLRYSRGVSEADSALIRGNPNWNSFDAGESLHYRLHGGYTTDAAGGGPSGGGGSPTGGCETMMIGRWFWESAP